MPSYEPSPSCQPRAVDLDAKPNGEQLLVEYGELRSWINSGRHLAAVIGEPRRPRLGIEEVLGTIGAQPINQLRNNVVPPHSSQLGLDKAIFGLPQ